LVAVNAAAESVTHDALPTPQTNKVSSEGTSSRRLPAAAAIAGSYLDAKRSRPPCSTPMLLKPCRRADLVVFWCSKSSRRGCSGRANGPFRSRCWRLAATHGRPLAPKSVYRPSPHYHKGKRAGGQSPVVQHYERVVAVLCRVYFRRELVPALVSTRRESF
jgi:hypothetical protein